jgi:lysophospholipase L1-like esterase
MSTERIKAVIEQYQERLRGNIMEDGRTRWEYYNVQRRIAQAAYNYNGYIVTGTRHSCPIMEMQIMMIKDELFEWCGLEKMVQGFTDQFGNFLTRKEAHPIALAAGQIIREDTCPGTLYSECYI